MTRHRRWHVLRPRHLDWWVGAVLTPGALCFLLAPIPWVAERVGDRTDIWAFFVGSVFFTTSGTLQMVGAIREKRTPAYRLDLWSSAIQLTGMLMFNLSTFAATSTTLDASSEERLVWVPDWRGSVCFLLSAIIACVAVGDISWPPQGRRRWTATVNLLGCVFFFVSAVAAFVLPDGEPIRAEAANRFTSLGAACFLICAVRAMADADLEVGITPKRIERQRERAARRVEPQADSPA